MLKELVKTKRNFVLIGESGSGKSEIALFLAKTLSDYTDKKIRLIDMDQTKGMYRSRDWKERVENDQIHVYCGEHFMDMPLVPHGMANKLDDENAVNILDVGGNEIGAVVLGQYSQWLNNENSVVFYIINPYRNFSGSKDNILFLMERIQKAGHIQKIHVISNPNLGPSTTEEDVCNGHEILKKMLVDTEYEIEALMIPVWLPKEVFINMDIPVYFIKPMIQFFINHQGGKIMAKVEINKDYCKSCRLCINVCPKQVLFVGKYTNKMGYDAVEMDETKGCIGCKMCATMCPEGAIEVYK